MSGVNSDDRERRKEDAEEFVTVLEDLAGVDEVVINDASPRSWQEVEYFIYLEGEHETTGMDIYGNKEGGFRLADNVSLRSLAQLIPSTIKKHDKTSLVFSVRERPTKEGDLYDQGYYVVDVGFP